MTTSIKTDTITSSSPIDQETYYDVNAAAFTAHLQKTLREVLKETEEKAEALKEIVEEGQAGTDASKGSKTHPIKPQPATSFGDVSSDALERALAGLMQQLSDEQNTIAQAQLAVAGNSQAMLDKQQLTNNKDYLIWEQDFHNWIEAQKNKTIWQQVASGLSDAFKFVEKHTIDAAQDAMFGGHIDVETVSGWVDSGLNYVTSHMGNKIFGDIVVAIALAVLITCCPALLTAGAEAGAAEAGAAFAEGAGAAGEIGAEEAGAAFAEGAGEAEAGAGASEAEEAGSALARGAEKAGMQTLKRTILAQFGIATYVLQKTDFATDIAKACTNDPATQIWIETAVNLALTIVGAVATTSFLSSFGTSSGIFQKIQMLQDVNMLFQGAGQIGAGAWSVVEADITKTLATDKANMQLTGTYMQVIEENTQQMQNSLMAILNTLSSEIANLGRSIPQASAAAAQAIA